MGNENIERQKRYIAEQQAESAVRMRELEDIVVQFERATRDRAKANEQVKSQVRKKEKPEKTDDTLASLVAEMERHISERRNRDSTDKH